MRVRLLRDLRKLSDESGQALVLAALGMVALLGFVALAVDVGQLRYAKRQLQMAADAAAIAAALEIVPCAGSTNCSIMTAAIQSSLKENGLTGSTLTTHCVPNSGTGLLLTINNGPCSLGLQDPNFGKTNFVEVILQKTSTMYFARALGISSMPISVRAEAALTDNGYCIYALDKTASGSLITNPGTVFGSTCAIMVESNSSTAAICNSSTVNVSFVAIVGGGQSNGCVINIRYAIGVPFANTFRSPGKCPSAGGPILRYQHYIAIPWFRIRPDDKRGRNTLSGFRVLRRNHNHQYGDGNAHAWSLCADLDQPIVVEASWRPDHPDWRDHVRHWSDVL